MGKRFVGLGAVLAAAAAIAASPAAAANIDCGPAGGIVTGTVTGSVTVGPGVTCVVAAAHVGGLVVQPGGALVMLQTTVDRSVQSNGAAWIVLAGSNTVKGSVQIVGTAAIPPGLSSNAICTTAVAGSLMLSGNTAPFLVGCAAGAGNTLGSALISGNTGAVTFQFNTVTGSGLCGGTITGSGNTYGRKLGCP